MPIPDHAKRYTEAVEEALDKHADLAFTDAPKVVMDADIKYHLAAINAATLTLIEGLVGEMEGTEDEIVWEQLVRNRFRQQILNTARKDLK